MRCKLSEIALVSAGQGAPQGDSNYCESGTPFVKAGNLQELSNGASIDAIQKVSNEVAATHGLKLQRKGSVLFAKSGMSCLKGYVYVLPEDAYIVSHLACVTPMGVDSDYLCYYFRFHRPNKLVKDAAYPSISLADIGCLEIEIPEGNEVTQIVDALKRVESIINLHCQQITALDTLIKARFVEMFGDLKLNSKGWEIKPFEDLTDLITDGEHNTPRRVEEGIYLLSARNVLNHSFQLDDVDYIDQEEYDRIAKRITPQEGDVLISCSGTVGRCCSVPAYMKFQMVRSVALLRFKKEINPVFAEYMITSDYLQEQINSSKTASSQANLFQGKIAKLKGFVPPRYLQDEFLTFVAQIDKSKAVVQAAHVIARNLHSRRQQKCRILNF